MDEKELEICKQLGHKFHSVDLFRVALSREPGLVELGKSVTRLVLVEQLLEEKTPQLQEKLKWLTSNLFVSLIGAYLGLRKGHTDETLFALLGAVFQEVKFDATNAIVKRLWTPMLETMGIGESQQAATTNAFPAATTPAVPSVPAQSATTPAAACAAVQSSPALLANPKSTLMELVSKRKMDRPVFHFLIKDSPNCIEFEATCTLSNRDTNGKGKSKKEAERNACAAMLHLLAE